MSTSTEKVAVVGGGIIGSWAALHLAEAGAQVTLIEQFPLPHTRGSSHGLSRAFRFLGELELDRLDYSLERWQQLEQSAGEPMFIKTGLMNFGPAGDPSLALYMDVLVYSGEHFSPCCLPGMGERTVTIGSLSKSHAMSGWRVGWLIGPPEMAAHGGNINMCMLYGSPGFIQDAAQLALTQPIPELNDMRLVYQQRRDSFYQVLKDAPGLQCLLPEAGMFVMIDIRPTGTNTKEFTERLLENHGVAVLAGDAFGPSAAGFIRCSLGLEEGELLRAAERIAACAASY